ncbi:S8 family serine peptidase [Botryobacter ruber]|uniref:S8 family serine peptidase n=1 Tax=Botryobacter ruber TaxID=2171629 RepID=UPI001F0BDB5D|nr:S8 family serine peptidase [Botryobacter ruber]
MKKFTFGKALSLTALASAMVLSSCQKEEMMEQQFASPSEAQQTSETSQAIEGQYIVVFKDGTTGTSSAGGALASASVRQAVLAQSGIQATAVKETFQGAVKGFAAKLSSDQLKELRNNPEVAYIEQDKIISLGKNNNNGKGKPSGTSTTTETSTSTTTDTNTSTTTTEPTTTTTTTTTTSPTTTTTTTTSSGTVAAITPLSGELVPWNIQKVGYGDGRGKTVWIIDSGVDTDHPDLTVDLSKSKSFVSGTTSVEDGYGHGTTVAGIIAAKNNGSGMIGVASGATIVALRVFDNAGAGTLSSAISAVSHVNSYAKAGDVVNMSIGSGISSTLDYLVKSAASKGIKFAIAAGNSGVDCASTSPARVDAAGVYTVSAMDSYARLWDRSNYGLAVDFAAPGVNVTTTTKGGSIGGGAYGTSFAAPHVAGILLLKGTVSGKGTITGDKDSKADPIASLN